MVDRPGRARGADARRRRDVSRERDPAPGMRGQRPALEAERRPQRPATADRPVTGQRARSVSLSVSLRCACGSGATGGTSELGDVVCREPHTALSAQWTVHRLRCALCLYRVRINLESSLGLGGAGTCWRARGGCTGAVAQYLVGLGELDVLVLEPLHPRKERGHLS